MPGTSFKHEDLKPKVEEQKESMPRRVTLFETQQFEIEESAPDKNSKRVSMTNDDELKNC